LSHSQNENNHNEAQWFLEAEAQNTDGPRKAAAPSLSATLWALASGLQARLKGFAPVMDEMIQAITFTPSRKPYRASKQASTHLGSAGL
jgi:hypothetical protein